MTEIYQLIFYFIQATTKRTDPFLVTSFPMTWFSSSFWFFFYFSFISDSIGTAGSMFADTLI